MMNVVSNRFFAAFPFCAIVLAACSGTPEQAPSRESTAAVSSALSTPTWELEEYPNSCADQCEIVRGKPPCWCITNQCSASLDGQACTSVGATCNVVFSNYYREMICEAPTAPTPTWTRISTDTCSDLCGTSSCGSQCALPRCTGNPEGQACSNTSLTCYVVSGPSVVELSCQ